MKSSAIVSRLVYDRDEFVLGNFRYTCIAYIYVPCILPLQFQDIFRIYSGYFFYLLYCNIKLLHDISIENMVFFFNVFSNKLTSK